MKIAISAESTIDLGKELLKKYDIKVLPYRVLLGEKEYIDGEISSEEVFAFVERTNILPKTSAINQEQYKDYFGGLLKNYDAVIHFALSSGMSSSCQNALIAASEFSNVFVVDSQSLSTGIALLAINARRLANEGKTAEEVFKRINERVPFVQASFVVERLDYLYKGGRCSALSYFGANLLKIRPQIIVKNGKMDSYKKYRGSMDKVVENYCKDVLQEFDHPDKTFAFITYTTATEKMVLIAKKALEESGFENIIETQAGGAISSHCGEHTLGILYLNDGDNKH